MDEPARPTTDERVAIVLNPSKPGAAEARDLVEAAVRARGSEPVVHLTTVTEPGAAQAREALQGGCTAIVAVGGDGTVREVVHALVDSPRRVPLGIVPLGTANLFARNLSLAIPHRAMSRGARRRQVEHAIQVALDGATTAVDVGVARFGEPTERHLFLVVAGIGWDAETVLATRPELKQRIGWGAYFASGLRRLGRRGVPMTLQIGGRPPVSVRAWSVLAGNCGRIPLGATVFPDARYDDGVLDVLTAQPMLPHRWVGVAATGLSHRAVPEPLSGLHYERAARLEVVPDRPMPVQLDGDAFAAVPRLDLSVLTRALTVRVGRPRPGRSRPGRPRPGRTAREAARVSTRRNRRPEATDRR